jgi:hypothetical protein
MLIKEMLMNFFIVLLLSNLVRGGICLSSRNVTLPINQNKSNTTVISGTQTIVTKIDNENDMLRYILIVENLLSDLYNTTQTFLSSHNVPDDSLKLLNPFLASESNNTDIIHSLNRNIYRPACTYTFNDTSIETLQDELIKFEKIAVSMYNSLTLPEGPLYDIKYKHKSFLDNLLGENTSVVPLNIRSVINLVAENTINCTVPIPFISFFKLDLNGTTYNQNTNITLPSVSSSLNKITYCAFVTSAMTIWSKISNNNCLITTDISLGNNYLFISNETSPITDTLFASVLSGPVEIKVLSALETSFAISNHIHTFIFFIIFIYF